MRTMIVHVLLLSLSCLAVAGGCRRDPAGHSGRESAPAAGTGALARGVHWDGEQGILSLHRGRRACTLPFVRVKAGTYVMGGTDYRRTVLIEGPPHRVRIRRDFWLSATEVTREQWKAFSGTGAVTPLPSAQGSGPALPVTGVSWVDIQAFIKRISKLSGIRFRLPTEAEWEYACRAGSSSPWPWSGDHSELRRFGWYQGNSGGHLQPVAKLQPNPLGLYDMQGNAVEWTADSSSTTERVLRGGLVLSEAEGASCTCRYQFPATIGYQFAGFRLAADARMPAPPPAPADVRSRSD